MLTKLDPRVGDTRRMPFQFDSTKELEKTRGFNQLPGLWNRYSLVHYESYDNETKTLIWWIISSKGMIQVFMLNDSAQERFRVDLILEL